MKMFKVCKDARCEVIESKSARSFTDLCERLEWKFCSSDKVFHDGELVADPLRLYNKRMTHLFAQLDSVERYVAACSTPIYAFERGGWIAFYHANDVEVVC